MALFGIGVIVLYAIYKFFCWCWKAEGADDGFTVEEMFWMDEIFGDGDD